MGKHWSVYRPPIEIYEVDDRPEPPRVDPIKNVFRLVAFFATVQALTLIAVLFLWLK